MKRRQERPALARRQQRIAGAKREMRVLDAAIAHHREGVPDSNAKRRNTAQRLQPDRMTVKTKDPRHRPMLPGQAARGKV